MTVLYGYIFNKKDQQEVQCRRPLELNLSLVYGYVLSSERFYPSQKRCISQNFTVHQNIYLPSQSALLTCVPTCPILHLIRPLQYGFSNHSDQWI